MELHHKLMRVAARQAVEAALREIRKDPQDGLRKLAEMGQPFLKSPAQKELFGMVWGLLESEGNSYGPLISRVAREYDRNLLATLGSNLGYTSLHYGVRQLREKGAALGKTLPWLVCLDMAGGAGGGRFPRILDEGRGLGIYTYLVLAGENGGAFPCIRQLARRGPECTFLVMAPPQSYSGRNLAHLRDLPNILLSAEIREAARDGLETARQAFRKLHSLGSLYGYHAVYTGENAEELLSHQFLEEMARARCLFGGYVNRDPRDAVLGEQVYSRIRRERKTGNTPLLLFEYARDGRRIAEMSHCGGHCPIVRWDGTVRNPGQQTGQ